MFLHRSGFKTEEQRRKDWRKTQEDRDGVSTSETWRGPGAAPNLIKTALRRRAWTATPRSPSQVSTDLASVTPVSIWPFWKMNGKSERVRQFSIFAHNYKGPLQIAKDFYYCIINCRPFVSSDLSLNGCNSRFFWKTDLLVS